MEWVLVWGYKFSSKIRRPDLSLHIISSELSKIQTIAKPQTFSLHMSDESVTKIIVTKMYLPTLDIPRSRWLACYFL